MITPAVKHVIIRVCDHVFYFEFTLGLTTREQFIEAVMYVIAFNHQLCWISFEEIYDAWFKATLK